METSFHFIRPGLPCRTPLLFLQFSMNRCCTGPSAGHFSHPMFQRGADSCFVVLHGRFFCRKHLRGTPFFRFTVTMHVIPNMDDGYEAIDCWIETYSPLHPNTRGEAFQGRWCSRLLSLSSSSLPHCAFPYCAGLSNCNETAILYPTAAGAHALAVVSGNPP